MDLLERRDEIALLRWFLGAEAGPSLRNTEGEPLRFVTASFRIGHPDAVRAALAERLGPGADGRFTETYRRGSQEWIRGTITIDGGTATIESNSTKRADRLVRTLLRAAPDAALLSREDRSIEDAMAEHGAGGGDHDVHPLPEIAGTRGVMDQFIRKMEADWVDQPIPALRGLTPRQALNDQEVRPLLEALLDDMSWAHTRSDSAGMNPERIRQTLGMAPGRLGVASGPLGAAGVKRVPPRARDRSVH